MPGSKNGPMDENYRPAKTGLAFEQAGEFAEKRPLIEEGGSLWDRLISCILSTIYCFYRHLSYNYVFFKSFC